jgi:hypothetical protein
MKNILLAFCLFLGLQLSAQHETLFDNVRSMGAFGGPLVEIGSINGEVGSDVGGGGALILDNVFIGGYGLGSDYPEITIDDELYNIRYKHGGFWLGYTAQTHKVAHLYSSVKIGWGKAQLRQEKETLYTDRMFVMIPEIGVELNLTDFFKIALTGGYRWVNGINKLPSLDSEDFSSPVGVITFRFGGFDDDWDWDF